MEGNEEWSDQALDQIITQASTSFYTTNSYPFSETDLQQLNKINKDYVAHDNVYRVRYLLDEQSYPNSPVQSPTLYSQMQNYFSPQVDSMNKSQPYNSISNHMNLNEEEEYNSNYAQQVNLEENEEEEEDDDDDYAGGDGSLIYGSDRGKRPEGGVVSKDDKRKRNTAASARFRIKKKLKEQELQKTASEMMEKASKMESRVHELEREIKWLKALIVEKNDARLQKLVQERPSKEPFYFSSSSDEKKDKKQKK